MRERGEFELAPVDEAGMTLTREEELFSAKREAAGRVAEIRHRYTRRMHDLSWFMKSLLERFTKWFNGKHSRSGTLWEDRFKSVIVESGVAARMIAAYIDLNPVRAGMVSEPADYRWSGYGEAIGGGKKGNGKKSREGEVEIVESGENETVLPDVGMARMLRCRVRYFADGAGKGSKVFVNEAFVGARERFTERRKDGARKMRGSGAAAKGVLWSIRDLRVRV